MTQSENGTSATPEAAERDVGKKKDAPPKFVSREADCAFDITIEVDAFGKPEKVEQEIAATLERLLADFPAARIKRIKRAGRRS